MTQSEQSIVELLDKIRQNFPTFRTAVVEASNSPDIKGDMQIRIEVPQPLIAFPTFEPRVSRPLTPMLEARFQYASRFRHGLDIWLGLQEMSSWIRKKTIRTNHRVRRESWFNSPPNLHHDSQLSLFGITLEVPQNVTYLVWGQEEAEPRIWCCSQMSSEEYRNLADFLQSFL